VTVGDGDAVRIKLQGSAYAAAEVLPEIEEVSTF